MWLPVAHVILETVKLCWEAVRSLRVALPVALSWLYISHLTSYVPQGVGSANAPLFLDVPPVAWLGSGCLGSSLPCTVEWLPALPHDLLLVTLLTLYCAQ